MNVNGTRVYLMHSRDLTKGKTRITLASYYDPATATMHFGVSRCHKRDMFNKKTGRNMAIGRFDLIGKKPSFSVAIEPEADLQRFFRNKFYQVEDFLKIRGLKKIKQLDNTPGAELAFQPEHNDVKEPTFESVIQ